MCAVHDFTGRYFTLAHMTNKRFHTFAEISRLTSKSINLKLLSTYKDGYSKRASNLRSLLRFNNPPVFIGGRNNGYAQPMSNNERQRELQKILNEREATRQEILARHFKNYR